MVIDDISKVGWCGVDVEVKEEELRSPGVIYGRVRPFIGDLSALAQTAQMIGRTTDLDHCSCHIAFARYRIGILSRGIGCVSGVF